MTKTVAKKKAPTPKAVWVVGAGASKSHSTGHFPTLLELPEEALRLEVFERDPAKNSGFKALTRYLNERGFPAFDGVSKLNLESVLTSLELDIAATSNRGRLLLTREFVLRVLRRTIHGLHREAWTSAGEYEWLATKLRASDSVVTFNWDYLLDDALGRCDVLAGRGEKQKQMSDKTHYGRFLLRFTGFGDGTWHNISPAPPVASWKATKVFSSKPTGLLTGTTATTPHVATTGECFRSGTRRACRCVHPAWRKPRR